MRRSILVGISAAVLSWVLLVIFMVAWLSWTRPGQFVRDPRVLSETSSEVHSQYGEPIGLLRTGQRQQEIVILPLISAMVGIFVGLVSRTHVGVIAVLALLPLEIFLLVANSFEIRTYPAVLVYLAIAYLSAEVLRRMRTSTA